MHQQSRGKTVVKSALVMLLVYTAGLALLWIRANGVAAENALMENLQAGALALACVLLMPCLVRSAAYASRFTAWSMLLVFLAMLLREVDVETLSVPAVVKSIASGTGRDVLLGATFIVTAMVLVRRRHELIGYLIQFAFSRVGALLAVGCVLYASSLPFDKSLFGLSSAINQFFEEVVECGATLMFLLAAVVKLVQHRNALQIEPVEKPTPIPASRIAA